jgi:uncharacterized metal-binding protein YceD (DUF177 family)
MIIQFQKATPVEKEFSFETDGVCISGSFSKVNSKLVQISAHLQGALSMNCTRCAKPFHLEVDEDISLRVSNGVYKERDNILEDDIIETFDENINFDEIFQSEFESIRSDFHVCDSCQDDLNDLEIQL